MKTIVNVSSDKKDLVKASNAVTAFKDVVNTPITMTGVIIYEKVEEDGETKVVSAIKLDDGSFVTSISPTVQNSLESIVEAYDEDEIKAGLPVMVKAKASKQGREFLYIDLI